MFIDIESPKKPLEAEKIYNKCYRRGEEITPEICVEVLRSTNFKTCIKRMLTCVERLPAEKQAEFKDVVLATFTNREQPEEVVEIGKRLAEASGYRKAFDAVFGRRKRLAEEDEYDEVRQVRKGGYLVSAPTCKKGKVFAGDDYEMGDFRGLEGAVFTAWDVDLTAARNLPAYLDFSKVYSLCLSQCELGGVERLILMDNGKVDFRSAKSLPADLDVSMCDEVSFYDCDLSGVKNLKFKYGARVKLDEAENLPEDLDVSMCDYVSLDECDLSGLKNLKFKDGAKVSFGSVKNLPADLDVSMCDEVSFYDCDLSGVKNLKFKEGLKVDLRLAQNLPEVLDLSMAKEVDFLGTDFANVKSIILREGAWVDFQNTGNLPKELDVSMVEMANFGHCDLKGVEKIRFKNREQLEYSCLGRTALNWNGKLEFEEGTAAFCEAQVKEDFSFRTVLQKLKHGR